MNRLTLSRRELLTAGVAGVALASLSPVMGASDFLGIEKQVPFAPQAWAVKEIVSEAMLPHVGRTFVITLADGSRSSATLSSVTNHSKQPDVVQFSFSLKVNGKAPEGPVTIKHHAFGSLEGIYLTKGDCSENGCSYQATICRLPNSVSIPMRGA